MIEATGGGAPDAGRRLHHVGIVQPSEDEARNLMTLLNLEEDYRGYVPTWSALCIFTKPLGASPLEFVVPDGGPLVRFNKGLGGLHHVAFEVDDLEQLARDLAVDGIKLLEPQAVKGAGEFLCNFLSPVYTRGLTVEYVQPLRSAATGPATGP
jgi:catechol 2,3-dioxygenase-like lactoylglutathione lyase family enzyme